VRAEGLICFYKAVKAGNPVDQIFRFGNQPERLAIEESAFQGNGPIIAIPDSIIVNFFKTAIENFG
jgi:hypothetical protein